MAWACANTAVLLNKAWAEESVELAGATVVEVVGVGLGVDVISDLSINQVQRDAATASLFKIAWIEGNANRSFLGFGIL